MFHWKNSVSNGKEKIFAVLHLPPPLPATCPTKSHFHPFPAFTGADLQQLQIYLPLVKKATLSSILKYVPINIS